MKSDDAAMARERYLRFLASLSGCKVKMNLYEGTCVSGEMVAVQSDGTHYMVKNLSTPIGQITSAVLRQNMCNPESTYHVLNEIHGIADMYMIDYFIDDYWTSLPSSWRSICDSLKDNDWAWILSLEEKEGPVLPLSLLCIRKLVSALSIRRSPISSPKEIDRRLGFSTTSDEKFDAVSSRPLLRRRIKAKKQHEIDRVIALVQSLQNVTGLRSVVDIGAGLGHLSRLLAAVLPDVNVHTIEGDPMLVSLSRSLDEQMSKRGVSGSIARHLTYVSSETYVNEIANIGIVLSCLEFPSLLIGLHPCGDLSPSMFRMFRNFSKGSSVAIFGCCYHKLNRGLDKLYRQSWESEAAVWLTTNSKAPGWLTTKGRGFLKTIKKNNDECAKMEKCGAPGFPMSTRFKHWKLSYAARELACHAREQFVEQLRNGSAKGHEVHCYRALLEKLIVLYGGDEATKNERRHLCLRGLTYSKGLKFEKYVEAALENKPALLEAVHPYIAEEEINIKTHSHRVFSIYCLRLLIGSLVESLIVYDRLEYLKEQDIESTVIPIFDPKISARNLVIIGMKK